MLFWRTQAPYSPFLLPLLAGGCILACLGMAYLLPKAIAAPSTNPATPNNSFNNPAVTLPSNKIQPTSPGVATLAWGQFYPLAKTVWQPRPHAHIARITPGYWATPQQPHQPAGKKQPAKIVSGTKNPSEYHVPVTLSSPIPIEANPELSVEIDSKTNTIVLHHALLTRDSSSSASATPITLTLQLPSSPSKQEVSP